MKKIIIVISIMLLGSLLILKTNEVKNLDDVALNSNVINNDRAYIKVDKEYNYGSISEEVKSIAVNYPEFLETINQADIEVPIFKNMVPQGISLMGDYVLITTYDSESKNNSLVYVLNKEGKVINKVNLGNKSHVGGIAYDKINNLIWIPDDNGILNAYIADDFLDRDKVVPKYIFTNVSDDLKDFLDEDKKLIAFLTVDDNYIYLGNFAKDEESIVKKYEIINNGGKINLNYINSFMVPARTQSITFFDKGNKKYMIMSNSYQRRKSSYIRVYEYDEKKNRYDIEIRKIELPPMLEQIATSGNSLYIIFESKAKKYDNCPEKIGYTCILDIYKVLDIIG